MENLKYIEAGLRAAETVRISPRKIWMILEIAAQLSANGNVAIKEILQLREEADRLFDADGNLKPETEEEPDGSEPTEPRKTGWDFGAIENPINHGETYWTMTDQSLSDDKKIKLLKMQWDGDKHDFEWLKRGEVFNTEEECQQYVNYLNSLTDGHS